MRNTAKYIWLIVIICFLLLHLAQDIFRFEKDLRPLDGAIVKKESPVFTFEKWFSGEYQEAADAYLNDEFGFRNNYVRINNQLAFWLFKKAKANDVIIGKEDYIYESAYIDAHFGKDFIGQGGINDTIQMIKFVQDTFAKLNKTFFVVLAPSKADYFPEYIPNHLVVKKGRTNYEAYTEGFIKEGINFIDFNALLQQKKAASVYPLFPQYGIHWSKYSAFKAIDSIARYVENKRGINLPDIIQKRTVFTDELREPDYDLVKGMNLLWRPPTYKMAYADFEVVNKPGCVKPTCLVIADSYWWDIYNMEFSNSLFTNGSFWYYNEVMYPDSWEVTHLVKDADTRPLLDRFDVIIVIATEPNLKKLGYGFFSTVKNAYGNSLKGVDYKIPYVKEIMRGNKDWMKEVAKKSKEKGISVDSMMTIDALWFLTQNPGFKITPTRRDSIAEIAARIRQNPDQLKEAHAKAKARGIPVDSMIKLDAEWIYEYNKQNKK